MNKSKQFILPLFCEFIFINFKIYNKIENTYLYADNFKNDGLILKCKKDIKDEDQFLESLYDSDLLEDVIEENDSIIYFLLIPTEYLKEYSLIKEGKYSKIDKKIKDLILDFYIKVFKNNTSSINLILNTRHTLFKDAKLKRKLEKDLNIEIDNEAELNDPPNNKKEKL